MAEFRVRFQGDEGNQRNFFAAIQNNAQRVVDSIKAVNAQIARTTYNIPRPPKTSGTFVDVRGVRAEIDSINNVIKFTQQLGITQQNLIRNTRGGFSLSKQFLPVSEVQTFKGNVREMVAAAKNYGDALVELNRLRAIRTQEFRDADRIITARKQLINVPTNAGISSSQQTIDSLRQRNTEIGELLRVGREIYQNSSGIVHTQAAQRIQQLEQERLQNYRAISREIRTQNQLEQQRQAFLATDVQLLGAYQSRLNAANAYRSAAGAVGGRLYSANQAYNAALRAEPDLPTSYQYLRQQSPDLARILERAGLATTGNAFYAQQAQINEPRVDLTKGVTRYSGQFVKEMSNGIKVVQDFSAEVDKDGKVLTRFGGQLSGAGQILKQISRDFQKVIEWTVATTVVFGGLQYAIQQLNNLKELDAALQRFAITAQLSPTQAAASFNKLRDIAIGTATPLKEIIGAADDIALATQRAGQSTEQWQRDIYALTESVGIFTNLTGTDTVTATDLLTASMKQLSLTAQEIPSLLSKITAVAGGQSQAINDITKGLSVMAEAGKQANLTVDQQIATVQVLSQVTSKSPAEVATAFKNLVGSLGSPGSLKGLEKFNIAVRDQAGNLRNILDVYKEISDKIKAGIIPAADVQGLVRAISGGPRRAPDAAALLNAIDQITLAEKKSLQATNEAAIANAKVLDTTQAKLVQLQNAIDARIFERFGAAFKGLVGSLLSIAETITKAFDIIPSALTSAIVQVGLFFVLIRGGVKVLTLLGSFLRQSAQDFISLATAATGASGAVGNFNRQAAGGLVGPTGAPLSVPVGRASLFTKANLAKIGAGAALGAGITAASGGSLGQAFGGGLQGAGLALLALPEPTLLTKVAGGISLVAGTILQFASANNSIKEDSAEKASRILTAFSNYKSASLGLADLTKQQSSLGSEIERLSASSDKSGESLNLLSDKQKQYAENILAMADATKQLNAANAELNKNLSPQDAAIFNAAKGRNLSGADLENLIQRYQKILLQQTNPNIQLPSDISIPEPFAGRSVPFSGSTQATGQKNIASWRSGRITFDLTSLEKDANRVKDLFTQTGDRITGTFAITGQNIGLIQGAIDKLKNSNDPLAEKLGQTFEQFIAQNDGLTALNDNLAIYQARIDALAIFNPTLAASTQKVKDFASNFADIIPTLGTRAGRGEDAYNPQQYATYLSQKLVFDYLKTGKLNMKDLTEASKLWYDSLDEGQKKTIPLTEFQFALFKDMPEVLKALGLEGKAAMQALADGATDAADNLEKLKGDLSGQIAGRLADLKASFLAGDVNKSQYAKQTADLKEYYKVTNSIIQKFEDGIAGSTGFYEALTQLQAGFADVTGLEDAANLSTDQFISRLLTLADVYGVNQAGLKKLSDDLVAFYNLVQQMQNLKIQIPVGFTFTSDPKKIREAIAKIYASADPRKGTLNPYQADMVQSLEALLSVAEAFSGIKSDIQKIYSSGTGSKIGTTPKTTTSKTGSTAASGPDVSTLDIPEEIAKSANITSLLQEAIKRAKALQNQIPGANKEASNDIVELLNGTKRILEVRGIKDDYLRKALEELADIEKKRLDFETKADTLRRIRVGVGDFAGLVNVPLNRQTGVSVGSPEGPITVNVNINGQLLTPAQYEQIGNAIAAAIGVKAQG